jgi:N-acetylglucosaminyldiphosphoundecaprenol N-acetyl-beta-D-mannosaminyltransferase
MIKNSALTVDILGCRVSRLDLAAALQALESMLRTRRKHWVVCLTVDAIMAARRDPRLKSLYNGASLALADGIPLLWASRILRLPVPGRAAGPDLLLAASAMAARRGYSFYLMGGGKGIALRLSEALRRMYPGLRIVGAYSPPSHDKFPAGVNARIVAKINEVKPDILWVGLGTGKQDRWIAENLERLSVRVAIGIGGAFDMYSGKTGRAPFWMQSSGLEWFYRFLREPRRLFRRYFLEGPPFLPLVIWQRLRRREPI